MSAGLREGMVRAGFHDRAAPTIFMGAKVFLLGFGTVLPIVLLAPVDVPGMVKMLVPVVVGVSLFFVPNMIVTYRRKRRQEEVKNSLPDAIDLLEICLSAGMSLDAAWNLVGEKMRQVRSVLADEMTLANLEIHLGASRDEALRRMAERTGAEELASLIAVLGQSERFGTSVADALQTFSESLREERTMRAEEAAEKVAVKLLFPMVLFIFPALIIVLAGPAIINMVKLLST
jgi:tight adherence protein C